MSISQPFERTRQTLSRLGLSMGSLAEILETLAKDWMQAYPASALVAMVLRSTAYELRTSPKVKADDTERMK